MGSDRLNGLSMLNIHRDEFVDTEAVLKQFDSSGHRRIALAFSK